LKLDSRLRGDDKETTMAWGESKAWKKGTQNQALYQALLDDAAAAPARNAKRKKIVRPEDMPWELSRHGLLGSKSGKHRQLAEECLYVLEGRGYDLHQDCDVEITDTYHWTPQQEVKRYEWEAGDVIYIPPNTISQHFNADPERPVRLISAVNRIFKACGLNDLEQIEDAPEYRPGVKVTPELVEDFLKGRVKLEV
jgi:hypothetical protein